MLLPEPLLKGLGLLSLLAFVLFGLDKFLAMHGARRIKEKTLIGMCALGGWPGGVIGMLLFRHKVSKGNFKVAVAIAILVNLLVIYLIFWNR
jgi:uncharacterized membrane protein YsdA (DUF1294 family)